VIYAFEQAIKYWYFSLPGLVLAGLIAYRLFLATEERQLERARQAEAVHQAWLDGPPPPLPVPTRFTQTWIQDNVPLLHPGQIPTLLSELRSRGWNDSKIDQRVRPYLPN
jgi:hypothetical protein